MQRKYQISYYSLFLIDFRILFTIARGSVSYIIELQFPLSHTLHRLSLSGKIIITRILDNNCKNLIQFPTCLMVYTKYTAIISLFQLKNFYQRIMCYQFTYLIIVEQKLLYVCTSYFSAFPIHCNTKNVKANKKCGN